jgi:hypothetical protein
MAEDNPIKRRFGNDIAPSFENDAEDLRKMHVRQRLKGQTTWEAVEGHEDKDINNPLIGG